jgi:PAS domain S-box-containing protein
MPRTRSLRFARRVGALLGVTALLVLATGKSGEAGAVGVAGIAVLGFAILGLGRNERVLTRSMAVLSGLLTLVALVTTLIPAARLFGIESSPIMAIILLAGTVAANGAAWGPRHYAHVTLGVGGLTMVAIGLTCLFVRTVGLFDLFGTRGFSEIPLALTFASALLGLTCIGLVWWDSPDPTEYSSSALIAVAIAGLVSSALLWQTLATHEELQIERMTAQESVAASVVVDRTFETVRRVLHQFVRLTRQMDSMERNAALLQLSPDLPSVEYLALLDSTDTPVFSVPDDNARLYSVNALLRQSPARPVGRRLVTRHMQIPNDTARILMHVPRCLELECHGGVVAILRSDLVMQRATGERPGWRYDLGPIRQRGYFDYEVVRAVAIPGIAWELATRPSAQTMATTRSSVPEVVLILGIITTALLTGMVRLGATAWQSAHTIERMRISTAISRATDAVWEWDVMTGSLHRSGDLWQHLGYDSGLRDLRDWLNLVHPDDRDEVVEAFEGLGEQGHDSFEVEYRVATAQGDWHTVVDRGRVIDRDIDRSVRRVMGITADVTSSRRAEQELREVEALSGLGRVAARVAHEINNPLAGIRSAFTLIKDAVPLDHPHQHYVGAIEREVERIGNVTRQLYEVYRPEEEAGSASLNTVCGDAIALLSQVNRSANVEFDLQLDGVPGVVPVSGALLRQIVYNLVQNAVDASPFGGTVDNVGKVERGHLILAVLDQGDGVPLELRHKIFEPFFTTKDATVRTSGMGLGLTMVARSVSAAGGTIVVDDVPGGGARFTVRLPLSD